MAKHGLWKKGDGFIVGVSGGPDSLCLLDVLASLAPKHGFTLRVAHVNYGLRGCASDLDQKLVEKQAASYGIPVTVFRPEKKVSGNLEESLRDIRYGFFETLRKRKKCDHIAVAHNMDDQAETLLLRLLRGSGLQGLSGMRPKNGAVIRPLIETSRQDILRYLEERGIASREDKSNRDTRLLRNRIRHELLPLLEKRFQPKTKKLLANTAALLAEDYAFLQHISVPLSSLKTSSETIRFSRSELLALPEPLIRRELRTILTPLLGGKPPEKNLIDEIMKGLKSGKSKVRTVSFRHLKLTMKGDRVKLFIS